MSCRYFVYVCLFALLAGCATTAPPKKTAEVYFKEGEDAYKAKHYEDAIGQWKKVKESYSSPELTAAAELRIGDAQFENKNYIEAAAAYENFRKFHPNHEKAPYALYRLGLCYYQQITGIDTDQTPVKNAVVTFEDFLKQYPASEFTAEVRQKLADCITKQVEHEVYVGRFYFRTEKYAAAIKRLDECITRYPTSPRLDEALFYLGKAYVLTGDRTKGREALGRLEKEFPASKFLVETKKFQQKYDR
jgi:outer membrane protein assembly factor BamD